MKQCKHKKGKYYFEVEYDLLNIVFTVKKISYHVHSTKLFNNEVHSRLNLQ